VSSSASHQGDTSDQSVEEEGEEEMSDGTASRMGVAGALGLSVTSSVSIVICNKYLISSLGFFFGEHAPELRFFFTDLAPPANILPY
jgi:hypothetical protein